ncbi:hypothetical protein NDU88_002880 [Pleurodeles waltl]|uniref:Uncharacterized protein n=1 Tax=Pleurodeles waltl TaxID=8319 RepID=A0AAV7M3N9_PLEWA|nr:hypothetical protein NDU88_002880 [Pleurodeles waltl]
MTRVSRKTPALPRHTAFIKAPTASVFHLSGTLPAGFGARCCVPNPNCLAERAVASAGMAFGADGWKEEKLASRRDSGAFRGYF